jgi:hypothetical protein
MYITNKVVKGHPYTNNVFFCFQITHNYAIQELISCIAEYILVFIFIYGTYERK